MNNSERLLDRAAYQIWIREQQAEKAGGGKSEIQSEHADHHCSSPPAKSENDVSKSAVPYLVWNSETRQFEMRDQPDDSWGQPPQHHCRL